ncbi:protein of unknown function [Thauera humireducens]|nr:protein of unknown function [Thauera humireducens]
MPAEGAHYNPSPLGVQPLPTPFPRAQAPVRSAVAGTSTRGCTEPAHAGPQSQKNFSIHIHFLGMLHYTSHQFGAEETGSNQNATPGDHPRQPRHTAVPMRAIGHPRTSQLASLVRPSWQASIFFPSPS